MKPARLAEHAPFDPVRIANRNGRSPFVLICDHASNFIPPQFGALGLDERDLARHIAWDPGALPVIRRMAAALDATLVESCVSRLVVDCNRPLDAPDLIAQIGEATVVPGNAGLSQQARQERVSMSWQPFHDAVESVVSRRLAEGRETRLVSVHSFTPVYRDVRRPWHISIIHDDDTRLAGPLIAALQSLSGVSVGINEPYSPADRVYFTLERHGRSRSLPCAMIEIRNDELSAETGQRKWADLLTGIFTDLELDTGGEVSASQETGRLKQRTV